MIWRVAGLALILAPWVFGIGLVAAWATGHTDLAIVCFFGAAYCVVAHDATPPMRR